MKTVPEGTQISKISILAILTGKLTEHLNQIDQEARKQVEIGGRKGSLFSVLCVLE